ncbi:MAG: response regulator transcription factor [Flavobacteriales bacterium]
MKILIADDDPDIQEFLTYNLKKEKYTVYSTSNGIDTLKTVNDKKFDLILLDVMMPEMDGIEACQEIRESGNNNVIIVMLSARDETYTKIAAFRAGCNDYITKPISPKLLLNKLKGLLKIKYSESNYKGFSKVGKYTIDHESHLISRDDNTFLLPKKQFNIFCLLASKPGKVFSRQQIYSSIWGNNVIVGGRTIDVHIRNIREKLGQDAIVTIKGIGYKILD